MQSSQFYDALKGHGVPCRLVILPCEQHQYAARESIMHIIWETDRWLQKYCANDCGGNKVMEANVETSQSPSEAVLDSKALTLNFTKISSLVRNLSAFFVTIDIWHFSCGFKPANENVYSIVVGMLKCNLQVRSLTSHSQKRATRYAIFHWNTWSTDGCSMIRGRRYVLVVSCTSWISGFVAFSQPCGREVSIFPSMPWGRLSPRGRFCFEPATMSGWVYCRLSLD